MLVTTLVGYWMGSSGAMDWLRLGCAMLGTALIAAAAAALNQFWERKVDELMTRTASRPLPSGRLKGGMARGLGFELAIEGTALLWLAVEPRSTRH